VLALKGKHSLHQYKTISWFRLTQTTVDITVLIGYALQAYPIKTVSKNSSFSVPQERWDKFLNLLGERVATPSESHPTVRCWSQTDLVAEIADIKKIHATELATTFPSGKQVLERLINIGWLRPVKLQSPESGRGIPSLYVMDMEATATELIDPLELLQACQIDGVLSYFGVLALHELTTQLPQFFHVARLSSPTPATAAPRTAAQPASPSREKNPLGTELFRFQGVTCYSTKRDPRLVPGIQLRIVGSRTWLRVTTLEQTLLDTLLHPVRCGGEAVVFEAWERGSEKWNEDLMAEHLNKINRPETGRRVGAMFDMLGIKPKSNLLEVHLQQIRQQVATSRNWPELVLLPEFSYHNLNTAWRVYTP